MNLNRQKNDGFTLVELLVVIAIIGILAAVVLVSLNTARLKSRDARRLADVRQVMTALELYYNDNGAYPVEDVNSHPDASLGGPSFTGYLAQYPTYPAPTNDGSCGTGLDYFYTQTGGGTGYTIEYCLGGSSGGFQPGVHTASPAGLQ
ncbi:MAG: type II secretion system GspH family protein [Candidatus Doudnabacteria bacterium]|nr:type II secretion system GspH family protein [Candidatus Doudnabacteria bacterium]